MLLHLDAGGVCKKSCSVLNRVCVAAQPCLARQRNSREDPEQKEARRREAAAAMSKMEFRSLEGLDLFGATHGCAAKGPAAKGTPLGHLHRKSYV